MDRGYETTLTRTLFFEGYKTINNKFSDGRCCMKLHFFCKKVHQIIKNFFSEKSFFFIFTNLLMYNFFPIFSSRPHMFIVIFKRQHRKCTWEKCDKLTHLLIIYFLSWFRFPSIHSFLIFEWCKLMRLNVVNVCHYMELNDLIVV